jgi:hypothetical protein
MCQVCLVSIVFVWSETNCFLGFNTTVTIQSHENSIPALPNLGRALSKLEIDVQVPRLRIPGDDNGQPGDDSRHFIKDATVLSALINAISSHLRYFY